MALGEGLGAAAVVPVRISEDGQHLLVFTSAVAGDVPCIGPGGEATRHNGTFVVWNMAEACAGHSTLW